MTATPEPNHLVMLQHLICFFLPSTDTSFIPVHRTGFSDAILIHGPLLWDPPLCVRKAKKGDFRLFTMMNMSGYFDMI
jgi:hypothetical protein